LLAFQEKEISIEEHAVSAKPTINRIRASIHVEVLRDRICISVMVFLLWAEGGCDSMIAFRFYCLNGADHIMHAGDLYEAALPAAIQAAYAACREHPWLLTARIEVWRSRNRLYVSPAPTSDSQ
jgi:hypothetical protein